MFQRTVAKEEIPDWLPGFCSAEGQALGWLEMVRSARRAPAVLA
jgi:hypothetical protein